MGMLRPFHIIALEITFVSIGSLQPLRSLNYIFQFKTFKHYGKKKKTTTTKTKQNKKKTHNPGEACNLSFAIDACHIKSLF